MYRNYGERIRSKVQTSPNTDMKRFKPFWNKYSQLFRYIFGIIFGAVRCYACICCLVLFQLQSFTMQLQMYFNFNFLVCIEIAFTVQLDNSPWFWHFIHAKQCKGGLYFINIFQYTMKMVHGSVFINSIAFYCVWIYFNFIFHIEH